MTSRARKAPVLARTTRGIAAPRVRGVGSAGTNALELLGRYGLPLALLLVLVLFSVWKPSLFFTWANFKATFSNQAVILMVALEIVELVESLMTGAAVRRVRTAPPCNASDLVPLSDIPSEVGWFQPSTFMICRSVAESVPGSPAPGPPGPNGSCALASWPT